MPRNERNVHCSGNFSVPDPPAGLALEDPEAPLGGPAKERLEEAVNNSLGRGKSFGY